MKMRSYISNSDHVESIVAQALQNAALDVRMDRDAGTCEILQARVSIFSALKCGSADTWLIRAAIEEEQPQECAAAGREHICGGPSAYRRDAQCVLCSFHYQDYLRWESDQARPPVHEGGW